MTRAAAVLVPLVLAGCGVARITPPPSPLDPVPAFVVDYGRHSSVLLPSAGDGKLHEYAFGDFDWFALNRNKWHDALDALFRVRRRRVSSSSCSENKKMNSLPSEEERRGEGPMRPEGSFPSPLLLGLLLSSPHPPSPITSAPL